MDILFLQCSPFLFVSYCGYTCRTPYRSFLWLLCHFVFSFLLLFPSISLYFHHSYFMMKIRIGFLFSLRCLSYNLTSLSINLLCSLLIFNRVDYACNSSRSLGLGRSAPRKGLIQYWARRRAVS